MKKFPKIFIASSSGSKNIAEEIRKQLNHVANVNCWFDAGFLKNGRTTFSELIRISKEFDMGIFIFNNDDKGVINEKEVQFTRDNVLFEYGLFVSSVGPENSFIFYPDNADFRIPTDITNLECIRYDCEREINFAVKEGVGVIIDSIKLWQNEQETKKAFDYFDRFYKEVEPKIINEGEIDYNRSFSLLLYMFGNEDFDEFRAFDLAFHRWRETIVDNEDESDSNQIVNYSNDILYAVNTLFKRGKCKNFRRILVIPPASITLETKSTLKKIEDSEEDARNFFSKGIIETRILRNPHKHALDYQILNDFALFTIKNEEFAIVETTLNSLKQNDGIKKCKILTDVEKLSQRKQKFDYFWDNETISISDFVDIYFKNDDGNTIDIASQTFFNFYRDKETQLKNVSIVVETAYLELIKLNDHQRYSHILRAFELIDKLTVNKILKKNIFLDSFINDFKPKEMIDIECVESCEITLNNSEDFLKLKKEVTQELYNRNKSLNMDQKSISTFYMTKTRNNAISNLKKILKSESKKKLFDFKNRKDGVVDISIINPKIDLGYIKDGNIVPNCVLLMAEHYYELFNFAYSSNPSNDNVWIFDFLTYSEKISVGQGAEAAVILYDWPKEVSIHILNCSYFEDGSSGGDTRYFGYKF